MSDDERKEYLAERRAMTKCKEQSSDSYDKGALVVSGATLVLSMIFLRHDASPLLFVGQLMLAVGMIALLASFLTSQIACQEIIDVLDQQYEGNEPEARSNGHWTFATRILNWISLVAISLGVLFVVISVMQAGG